MQTFNEFGLRPELLQSLEKMGFENPTPIQSETIPYLLESDNDLVALAQTGTGKTAAFGLPLLNKTDLQQPKIQTIILCPTRELCLQITSDMERFGEFMRVSIVPVYGGTPIFKQISALKQGCHVVVGTPGRVNDLINRRKLDLSGIRFLILDEADEMLKMGFKEEMDAILAQTPAMKQTMLFSATMPQDIASISGRYMNSPKKISVTSQNKTAENIEHHYSITSPRNTYQALRRYADMHKDIYGLVFCRTRIETKEIADKLIADGYNADSLHGDLSQGQRDQVMGRFRNRHLQILVATDVAARGLDVNDLTHVIHYHLPDDSENYVHRSGRTGRAGKSGISMAFITPGEVRRLRMLEKQIKKSFVKKAIPSGNEVFQMRLSNYLNNMAADTAEDFPIEQYQGMIEEKLGDISREELIKKLIVSEFAHVYNQYKNATDLNAIERGQTRREGSPRQERERGRDRGRERVKRGERGERGERRRDQSRGNGDLSQFSINLGAKNNLRPDLLINIINRHTPEHKIRIGHIDIQNKHTIFEADSHYKHELVTAFSRAKYKGTLLTVQTFSNRQ